jgi:hypothetical protein
VSVSFNSVVRSHLHPVMGFSDWFTATEATREEAMAAFAKKLAEGIGSFR